MKIELTEFEMAIARHIGKKRYEYARRNNIPDEKVGPQDAIQADIEAMAAEMAFCKYFNLYPDLQIGERNIYDAILPRPGPVGSLVDVKHTVYITGKLLAVRGKAEKPPDYYALITGANGIYNFCGFMRAEELLREERLGNLGHGIGYIALQEELTLEPS